MSNLICYCTAKNYSEVCNSLDYIARLAEMDIVAKLDRWPYPDSTVASFKIFPHNPCGAIISWREETLSMWAVLGALVANGLITILKFFGIDNAPCAQTDSH